MPSRVRHTGADFTPASSSDTCIFARKSWAKRLIALMVLGKAFHARASRAEPQAQPEAPPPTSEPRTPIEITVRGEVPANPGSKLRDVPSTVNTVTAKTLRERATTDFPALYRRAWLWHPTIVAALLGAGLLAASGVWLSFRVVPGRSRRPWRARQAQPSWSQSELEAS